MLSALANQPKNGSNRNALVSKSTSGEHNARFESRSKAAGQFEGVREHLAAEWICYGDGGVSGGENDQGMVVSRRMEAADKPHK